MKEEISEIIEKAQCGDEESFDRLYRHYYKTAFRYAYKLTKNKSDAEDVVQETFLMIHDKIKDLKSPYAFTRWMSKIILSNSVRLFRSHQEILIDDDTLIKSTRIEENIDFLPKEAFHKGLDTEVVTKMIQSMRPKQREVLTEVYLYQKTFKEVADHLGLPEGTIKSRSIQAKKVLKRMVDDYLRINEPLTFRDALAGSTLLSFAITKLKDTTSFLSANALQVVTLSACVVCGISASTSTIELLKQQKHSQIILPTQEKHSQTELTYPNTFKKQIYQNQEINTSKTAYFTLMNWANTKDKIAEKTQEERTQIQPIIDALQESNSSYDQLLESNGWYTELYEVNQ